MMYLTMTCFLFELQIRINPCRRSWYIRVRETPISRARSTGLFGAPAELRPYSCRSTLASFLADRGSIFKILWARSGYSANRRIICALVMGIRISLEDFFMIFLDPDRGRRRKSPSLLVDIRRRGSPKGGEDFDKRVEGSGKGGWNSTGPDPPTRPVGSCRAAVMGVLDARRRARSDVKGRCTGA